MQPAESSTAMLVTVLVSGTVFAASAIAVCAGWRPLKQLIEAQERKFDQVLRGKLLLNITPRAATVITALASLVVAAAGFFLFESIIGFIVGLAVGLLLPALALKYLWKRRLARLEEQLVPAIITLASGVRAGLNLIQAMQLISRDGPVPIRQEFAHLLGEYEYGVPIDQAMDNASERIGSGDFRLLFSAMHTHRERGGDLGKTLDRIAESIREIQRLEARVKTLTAQGRATARWLGAMPLVVMAILYFMIDSAGIQSMLNDGAGKLLCAFIVTLNVAGFLWIKKIVTLDI